MLLHSSSFGLCVFSAGVPSILQVLKIEEMGKLTCSIRIEQTENGVTDSDPIVLVIPHTCIVNTSCKITINGMTKQMQSFNIIENSSFFILSFELPVGTKEIDNRHTVRG